jgi:hypothetical protein
VVASIAVVDVVAAGVMPTYVVATHVVPTDIVSAGVEVVSTYVKVVDAGTAGFDREAVRLGLARADVMVGPSVRSASQEMPHEDGDGGVAQAYQKEDKVDVKKPKGSHGAILAPTAGDDLPSAPNSP